jgi:hypothetical protein
VLDENGILYTFSTIPQALGGAFGFLSAFVLYRFQSLNRAMEQDAVLLRGIIDDVDEPGENERFERALAQSQFGKIVAWIDRKLLKPGGMRNYNTERAVAHLRMRNSVAQQRWILVVLWIALCSTACVMAWSVWAIPRAHDWACQPVWAARAISVGVGAFTACLLLYLAVIWVSLTEHLSLFERPFSERKPS